MGYPMFVNTCSLDCDNIERLIINGCDTNLEKNILEDHILYCSGCREIYADYQELRLCYINPTAHDFYEYIQMREGNMNRRQRKALAMRSTLGEAYDKLRPGERRHAHFNQIRKNAPPKEEIEVLPPVAITKKE